MSDKLEIIKCNRGGELFLVIGMFKIDWGRLKRIDMGYETKVKSKNKTSEI